ncbi:glycosyl hydrolase [Legionella taurinensis]|uniref:Glycoside hydrolase family 3 protein n=1 Tax=Legionella taurinensis TaxID=70611 RepID=A0A3A5LEN5_9GAMM|nr:glycoside hydrolase family 3 N-terminal domain-containing protein [Legionella taurinensis]MDX1838715.1 glycoside hydrolase family 3 N-terminal domain-containing protein [Legionella taurinensis]PUT38784.1 glycosyl hydrolase [Legionella taurinensis]PUT40218.1 glycosyl hydrolase [Legionella taurinensis]PUT42525.1 glycosyl hydrolase [Legionella taurinensis]PUT45944.1 glycosyl hydrolase [Legionella taurinensis]
MNYLARALAVVLSLFTISETAAADSRLRDKIGQMLIVGFEGKTMGAHSPILQAIAEENIGGVILFDYSDQTETFNKNIESPKQVQRLNQTLQRAADKANRLHHRLPLPLLISVDYEGGEVNRLDAKYGFPAIPSAEAFAKLDEAKAHQLAETMAMTLTRNGFNLDFAPLIDVNVNPDNPVIGQLHRSFSSDPTVVAHYAGVVASHLRAHGLQCAYKHFPGHGSSTADSHVGFVDVSHTWKTMELRPYQQLLHQPFSCGMIMTAHIVNRQLDESGLPATLSHKVLTGLLRDKLKFDGVIVTDDMQMKAISDHYGLEKAVTLAINAGADMIMFGNQLSDKPQETKALVDLIEAKVKSGEISEKRIDEAYRHIVALKRSLKKD